MAAHRVRHIGPCLCLAALAVGADQPPRGVPANADHPPGASYLKDLTVRQRARLGRDVVAATLRDYALEPIEAARVASHRLAERLAIRAVELGPDRTPPPHGQSPEAGGPLTPLRLTPLFDSRPTLDALLGLIAGARARVDLMMFGWDDDPCGNAVADALVAAAGRGVVVRAMVDRGGYVLGEGNAKVARGEPTYLDRLAATPNIHVVQADDAHFRFDHRKVAVVDDRVVWTGGMILTQNALTRWHNFAFLVQGPLVPRYAELFDTRWVEQGGCRVARRPMTETPVGFNATARMVRTDVNERSLKEAVYGAVDAARHHIYVENPYFSDLILVRKLAAARARGVDVRAVLTLRGDVEGMVEFSTLTANHLLEAGASVYLYPAMTHVKAMSVDGAWAYVGTGNFDELSLRNNREVGLTVRGPMVGEIDRGLFLRDMGDSQLLRSPLPVPRGWLKLGLLALWY